MPPKSKKIQQAAAAGVSAIISPVHGKDKRDHGTTLHGTATEHSTSNDFTNTTFQAERTETLQNDTAADETNDNEQSNSNNSTAPHEVPVIYPKLINENNFQEKLIVNVVDTLKTVGGFDHRQYKQVAIPQVEEPDFDENSDQTYMKGIITQIIHSSGMKLSTYGFKNYRSTNTSGNKRVGNNNTSDSYDRILVIGDCGTNGDTFVIITNSAKESNILLADVSNSGSVGSFVAVIEAVFTGRTLGQNKDMPIMTTAKPVVVWRGSVGRIPNVPATTPPHPSTKWFALHGMQISVANLTMNYAICGGSMCDRQEVPTDKKNCGCMHMSGRSYPLVLAMRLFVKDQYNTTLFKVQEFRSWAFTTMCVGNLGPSVKHTAFASYEKELRDNTKNIVQYINNDGGWTILGWLRVGMEADSSVENGDQAQQIGATSVSPHIIRLIPTYTPIENLHDMKFTIPVTLG